MKKKLTVSGLVESGVVKNDSPDVLPKFKGVTEFSNEGKTEISVELIKPNPYQPRRIFPEQEINNLASSIEEIGLIQPIALRRIDDNNYQIIAGERRFRAFKQLLKTHIPSYIFICDESDMAVMAIAENVNREDLSDYEIGKSIRNVEGLFPTKKRLAESLGLQRQDMYRYFAFDSLPSFLIDKLEVNPRLISRSAADDIKKVINGCVNEEEEKYALEGLQEAISLLEAGELDQGKIGSFVTQFIKHYISGSINKEKEEFFIGSKRIGSFSKSSNGIVIRISNGILGADNVEKLKSIVNEIIKDAHSEIDEKD